MDGEVAAVLGERLTMLTSDADVRKALTLRGGFRGGVHIRAAAVPSASRWGDLAMTVAVASTAAAERMAVAEAADSATEQASRELLDSFRTRRAEVKGQASHSARTHFLQSSH